MGFVRKLVVCSIVVLLLSAVWHWVNYVDIEEFYAGKRIILTGASRGIGKSMAIQLSKLGAKLVLAARSEDKLRETQQQCLQHSPHVEIVVADVSREDKCKEIVDRAVEAFGGVDMLILNAALSPTPQWFTDMDNPGEKFSYVFGVNVLQSVHLVSHALPHLNRSHGIIVPVSSGSAIGGIPKVAPYSTSKHALHGFFKVLNQEFILTNTPVSISIMIVPFVSTDIAVQNWKPTSESLSDTITPEECADIMIRGAPLKRFWYHVDWTVVIVNRFYSLCPSLFDTFIRFHLKRTSHLFS